MMDFLILMKYHSVQILMIGIVRMMESVMVGKCHTAIVKIMENIILMYLVHLQSYNPDTGTTLLLEGYNQDHGMIGKKITYEVSTTITGAEFLTYFASGIK